MNYIALIFTVFFSLLAQASPELSEQEASAVISRDMSSDVLYWNPFPIPYEVVQGSKDPNTEVLNGLLRQKLITKEEVSHPVTVKNGRAAEKKLVLYWLYRGAQPSYEELGFYYGRPHLKQILSISKPVQSQGAIIAEVQVAWSVVDIQPWIKDPSLRKARTLRRSLESDAKPFSKFYYLEYLEGAWQIWRPNEVDDFGF
ncbi:MAG: hypothetical protein WAO12_09815 [Venatoribacter sp.]